MLTIPVSSTLLALEQGAAKLLAATEPSARLSEEPCAGKPHAGICEGAPGNGCLYLTRIRKLLDGYQIQMSSKLPESNNVYSTIDSPVNVELAKSVLKQEFPNAKVWIYTSAYNGAKTLHVDSVDADFEGYPMSDASNPSYLLNGGLAGNGALVAARIQSILRRFEDAGFSMSIEAYDSEEELIGQFSTEHTERSEQ